ncbi:Putative uncharacterized protein [Moritella viscosa]|nr:Putative uncharacterized protein [Moritella viscosa]SHO26164.1 Putative uncharacterized protein [Moritella viscosa]
MKVPKGVGSFEDAINLIDTDYLLLSSAMISDERQIEFLLASLLVYGGNLNREL